ncbi:DUF995 domain-containing protein [Mesorhizobium temperatum]|uniref:DUF995 domain-containing protein n=1 Tax=Mesorhizobium temperatum TaxID=241416 RepID=A0A271LGE8_9HYPH|nr:DUF995 domain-containing protein [Mesorhizobium temperatum]PAQ06318.1 hypothetical protein CIT26_26085 [Mesorhizobium temperatum]
MFSIRSIISSAVLFVFLLAGNAYAAPKQPAGDAIEKRAAAATPMKASAVEKLYAGRTWKWQNGGGFYSAETTARGLFSANRKPFAAWSRKRAAWSYAEGNWHATNGGKLCMRALWTSKVAKGSLARSGAITCFLHREKHGVVYQKPFIGGKWYVFRHNPARRDDEARKLVKGNRVSKEVSHLKANSR